MKHRNQKRIFREDQDNLSNSQRGMNLSQMDIQERLNANVLSHAGTSSPREADLATILDIFAAAPRRSGDPQTFA